MWDNGHQENRNMMSLNDQIKHLRDTVRLFHSETGLEPSEERINEVVREGVSDALADWMDASTRKALGIPIQVIIQEGEDEDE